MKIYTSYFGKVKKLVENNIVPVGICCFPPAYFNGINFKYVAPTAEILKQYKGNDTLYTLHYQTEVLTTLGESALRIFVAQLEVYSKGKDVALCCYEKPNDFCHRHLLAAHMNKFGYMVTEWQEPSETYMDALF